MMIEQPRKGWLMLVISALGMCSSAGFAQTAAGPHTVASPSGSIVATLGTEGALTWSVTVRGKQILLPSRISLTLDGNRILGANPKVTNSRARSIDQLLRPIVKIKRAEIRDRFNERRVDFEGDYALLVRVYDDGLAYRFITRIPGDITVRGEEATLAFPGDWKTYFPEENSLLSHQERLYKRLKLSEITGSRFCSLPALVEVPEGPKLVITEADLFDYPGMDLTSGSEPHSLKGLFPAYPTKVELDRDRNEKVVERADYLARTRGTRDFPWRVLVVADRDEDLLSTDIIYRLASENQLTETDWIRPGKVAWDWWNANNVYGVPFRAGVNTLTYQHYIDFAAENGIEYVILDEGWYRLGDLLSVVPEIDMETLAAYAKEKKVGLILWVVWKTLDQQMAAALDRFQQWGIKGIKVDFMQREDQWMVNFYERVAREAAKRRMLVDFHGAFKPTGLYRTWPNVITSEGVVGLEHSKWGADASPDNAVTFPFLRMLAGPVDYTPGAMINATKQDFKPIFNRPMSQGTRCHQLAMYIVFESPLQMLADSPSNYRLEPESLEFLKAIPTVWDETKPLAARIGEYIVVARRSGREWYVGALTNWEARDIELDLSFLGPGEYTIETFRDGRNADRVGIDYLHGKRTLPTQERARIHLAPGGGLAARVTPR